MKGLPLAIRAETLPLLDHYSLLLNGVDRAFAPRPVILRSPESIVNTIWRNLVKAGKLRHRVTIRRESYSTNSFGEREISSDAIVGEQWAEIRPLKGREIEIAGQVNSEATHRVIMRYVWEILPTDYLSFEGRRFNIAEIKNLDEREITYDILAIEMNDG